MDETMNMTAAAVEEQGIPQDEPLAVEDGELDAPETDLADGEAGAGEAAAEQAQQQEAYYPIKYNGQIIGLTLDEMTTLAQKGMNYDKISQRLQQAMDGPEHRLVERLAAANGMAPQEYLAQAEELAAGQFVRAQADKGVPEETARQMWQDRQELAEYRAMAARAADLQDAAARQEQAVQAEVAAFMREYPDVKPPLPPEVIAIKNADPAESITSAYRKWELEQLRMQMDARRADRYNRETIPGSAAGTGKADRDPFLDGWDDV